MESLQIKTPFTLAVVLLVLVVSACEPIGGDSDPTLESHDVAPSATSVSLSPLHTSTPTTELLPTATPFVGPVIIAANASLLKQSGQITFANPYGLVWSMDGSILGVSTREGLALFSSASLELLSSVVLPSSAQVVFSPTTKQMAVSTDFQKIQLRDILTGDPVDMLQPIGTFLSFKYSPDGSHIVTASGEVWEADVWDLAAGGDPLRYTGFETAAPVYSVLFSQDGQWLIWLSRGQVRVTNLASGEMGESMYHEDFVMAVALAPGGGILAAATDGTVNGEMVPLIVLWNPVDGSQVGVLLPGGNVPASLFFSPDGSLLAAAVHDRIIIYDVATQSALVTLTGHTDLITSLAFSPDGTTLASAGNDGTIRFWKVVP